MKVLLVYPNDAMNLIPANISVLSAHLKVAGHEVKLYDTSFFNASKFDDTPDEVREKLGQVLPVDLKPYGVERKKITIEELKEDFRKFVLDYNPGLIGFSTLEMTYPQGLELAKSIEDIKIPKIFGGIFPTSAPRTVIKESSIDMVCEGEGEEMLPELATALEKGEDITKILNLTMKKDGKIYRSGQIITLDDLPTITDIYGEKIGLRRPPMDMSKLLMPDYTIWDPRRFWKAMFGKVVRAVSTEFSRGCTYHRCTFCCASAQYNQLKSAREKYKTEHPEITEEQLNENYCFHREKPVDKFIEEIKFLRENYGITFVYFPDESFLAMRKERLDEFIEKYKELKIPFFFETRAETVRPGYAKILESIGCAGVAMGVESGSPELRQNLLKRSMTNETIIKAFKEFENSGIRTSANNIIGFPGETREQIMETVELNRQINADSIIVNVFAPYRGTELRKICYERGLVDSESIVEGHILTGEFYNGVLSPKEIQGIRRVFPLYVKFPKDRWDEIRKAETDDEIFEKLSKEYMEKGMLYKKKDKEDQEEISTETVKNQKKVYIPLCADIIHHGHLNLIKKGRGLGEITIGLLTDEAIASYKRLPFLTYEQRKIIAENIKGVKEVIPQKSFLLDENIKLLKPDYIVHGDDWKTGFHTKTRENTVNLLDEYGGQLIEVPYTQGVSSTKLIAQQKEMGITPEVRIKNFKRLLRTKPIVRLLEAHNGLTGCIVEKTKIINKEGLSKEFDGVWISSLTDSVSKGKPDTGIVDLTSRINTINQVLESTTKPIILDGDNGGELEHFPSMIRTLERLGVSGIIIEDKIGLKENSLYEEVKQKQDDISNFSYKISQGKKAQLTEDFSIIARIESLILRKGIDDALIRAQAYINAGVDAIMIHSKEKESAEILQFLERYNEFNNKVPIVVVPTTYNHITETQLKEKGVNVVIYANHLLRSAYPAMKKTAEKILNNERSYECDEDCMPIKEILNLVSENK